MAARAAAAGDGVPRRFLSNNFRTGLGGAEYTDGQIKLAPMLSLKGSTRDEKRYEFVSVYFKVFDENDLNMIWIIGLLILFVAFAGGVLALVLVIRRIALQAVKQKIREAQAWPSTEGLVLASEVRDEGGENGWRARVSYRYEVAGRVYDNSRIAVAVEYGREGLQAHQELAARFPAGAKVRVYYNPQNPADAALIKGDPNSPSPSLF